MGYEATDERRRPALKRRQAQQQRRKDAAVHRTAAQAKRTGSTAVSSTKGKCAEQRRLRGGWQPATYRHLDSTRTPIWRLTAAIDEGISCGASQSGAANEADNAPDSKNTGTDEQQQGSGFLR